MMLLPFIVRTSRPEAMVLAAASFVGGVFECGRSRFGPTASAVCTAKSQLVRISISEPRTVSPVRELAVAAASRPSTVLRSTT